MQHKTTSFLNDGKTTFQGVLAGAASITIFWVLVKATEFITGITECFREIPHALLGSLLSI